MSGKFMAQSYIMITGRQSIATLYHPVQIMSMKELVMIMEIFVELVDVLGVGGSVMQLLLSHLA